MGDKVFTGNFTQQEPISEEAIQEAVAVLRSGRLHRYNLAEGESGEVALLEEEFAGYQGARYCLACASGGYAMHIALKAFGLEPGAAVLTNAFTLSPVPGAIDNAGGRAVLVEVTRDLVLDLQDLDAKIRASGAKLLLLSHMRGHQVDMERLCALLDDHDVALIEDCAHTMGAAWNGRKSGSFGRAACFSTQTYKHINSGEGGFLTSDDPDLMARAVFLSGSYMLYQRHRAAPDVEAMQRHRYLTPNYSGRMDQLRAAILRPQLRNLDRQVERWNQRYRKLEALLRQSPLVHLPLRPTAEHYVGSSIQFLLKEATPETCQAFRARCLARGVEVKWFGEVEPSGYTSRHDSWRYLPEQSLPESDRILARLFDMRIPLTFSLEECRSIGEILLDCLSALESADLLERAAS